MQMAQPDRPTTVDVEGAHASPAAEGILSRRPWLTGIALCGVALAIAIAISHEFRVATAHSGDFQWSGIHFLMSGQDPYRLYLSDPHQFILVQIPNYLPLLYFVLGPLGLASFGTAKVAWALINLVAGITTALWLSRRLGFKRWEVAVAVGLFVCSSPFSIAVGNGQQTLVVLAAAAFAFTVRTTVGSSLWLALSVAKQTFAPLAIFIAFRTKGITRVALAGAISLVAICGVAAMGGEYPWEVISSILRVNNQSTPAIFCAADLMSLVTLVGGDGVPIWSTALVALVYVGVVVAASWSLLRRADTVTLLALGGLASLASFRHLPYDYCFLLPAALCAYRFDQLRRACVGLAVAYFWWVQPYLSRSIGYANTAHVTALHACSFAVLVAATTAFVSGARRASPIAQTA